MKSTARDRLFRFIVPLFGIAFIVGGVIVTSLLVNFFDKMTRRTFMEALLNWGSSIFVWGCVVVFVLAIVIASIVKKLRGGSSLTKSGH